MQVPAKEPVQTAEASSPSPTTERAQQSRDRDHLWLTCARSLVLQRQLFHQSHHPQLPGRCLQRSKAVIVVECRTLLYLGGYSTAHITAASNPGARKVEQAGYEPSESCITLLHGAAWLPPEQPVLAYAYAAECEPGRASVRVVGTQRGPHGAVVAEVCWRTSVHSQPAPAHTGRSAPP